MEKLKLKYIFKNDKERQEGLMFKVPLTKLEAALFIWEKPSISYIWNKNVSFPIDVAFFNEEQRLINIAYLKAYQESPVFASGWFKYVLEVPYGWFILNKIPLRVKLTTVLKDRLEDLSWHNK